MSGAEGLEEEPNCQIIIFRQRPGGGGTASGRRVVLGGGGDGVGLVTSPTASFDRRPSTTTQFLIRSNPAHPRVGQIQTIHIAVVRHRYLCSLRQIPAFYNSEHAGAARSPMYTSQRGPPHLRRGQSAAPGRA